MKHFFALLLTLVITGFVSAQPTIPEIEPTDIWGYGNPTGLAWTDSGLVVAATAGAWLVDPVEFLALRASLIEGAWIPSAAADPANPDRVALSHGETVTILDVNTGETILTIQPEPLGSLLGLTFSADGTRLAATDGFGIYVWDTASGELIGGFDDETKAIINFELSPDGTLIFAQSRTYGLILWDIDQGDVVQDEFPFSEETSGGRVTAMTFTPDGEGVMAGDSNGHFHVWSLNGELLSEYVRPYQGDPNTPTVLDMAFLPDGRLITGETSAAGGIRVWSVEDEIVLLAETFLGGFSAARTLAFSPDGSQIAAINDVGNALNVSMYDSTTLENLSTFSEFDKLGTLTISPDGQYLITEGNQALSTYDTQTGEAGSYLSAYGMYYLTGISANEDSTLFAACGVDNQLSYDPYVLLWSPRESSEPMYVSDPFFATCDQTFFRDGVLHFAASQGIYRETPAEFEQILPLGYAWSQYLIQSDTLVLRPAREQLAIYDLSNLDAAPLELDWIVEDTPPDFGTAPLALSGNGRLLARREGDQLAEVALYDLDDENLPLAARLAENPSTVTALALSTEGTLLVAGHKDGTVEVWNIAEERLVAQLTGLSGEPHALVFTPDAQRVFGVGVEKAIFVWDLALS